MGKPRREGPGQPPPVVARKKRRRWLPDFGIVCAAFVAAFLVSQGAERVLESIRDRGAWRITPAEVKRMTATAKLTTPMARVPFTVTVTPGAPREAFVLAYEIMQAFSAAGWKPVVAPFSAYHHPNERGLRLGVRDVAKARDDLAVHRLMVSLPFPVVLVENVTLKDGEIMLAVGWRP